MKDELVLSQLEALAYKLGIAIRYDKVTLDNHTVEEGSAGYMENMSCSLTPRQQPKRIFGSP